MVGFGGGGGGGSGHANYAFVREFACVTPSRCQEFTCPRPRLVVVTNRYTGHRNEATKRPTIPAEPNSKFLARFLLSPRGHDRHVYRAFVPVSLAQIVLLKIVSLELRFCPTYPVESLIVSFFSSPSPLSSISFLRIATDIYPTRNYTTAESSGSPVDRSR